MQQGNSADNSVITNEYLDTLNESQLIEELASKTKQLTAAMLLKNGDAAAIKTLNEDIEKLQVAIKGKIF
ncbi:hypothetical protein CAP36_15770 [Chitinophagaceae bacterium IBVUCB2]|nr:hypothetical protein CAP36_15770 [Chitinophagaceae bacterium IBVUCB2]